MSISDDWLTTVTSTIIRAQIVYSPELLVGHIRLTVRRVVVQRKKSFLTAGLRAKIKIVENKVEREPRKANATRIVNKERKKLLGSTFKIVCT